MASASVNGRAHQQLGPWQARRVFAFVRANLAGRFEIEQLAAAARLGAGRFSTAFHADFGLYPCEYIIRRRVKRAQEQMLLTDKPLAAIAAACGLADPAHFTRVFRRIVGMTPGRWRRLRRSPLDELAIKDDASRPEVATPASSVGTIPVSYDI